MSSIKYAPIVRKPSTSLLKDWNGIQNLTQTGGGDPATLAGQYLMSGYDGLKDEIAQEMGAVGTSIIEKAEQEEEQKLMPYAVGGFAALALLIWYTRQ